MLTINNCTNNFYTPKNTSMNIQNNLYFGSLKNQPANDEFIKPLKKFEYLNNMMDQKDMPALCDGYHINEAVEKPFYQQNLEKAIPLLGKKNFTFDDYKKLSVEEKNILNNVIDKNEGVYNIKNCAKYILNISKNVKENLDKKYPQGYKVVSIGNSAAPFTETMKILGADTVTLPFSKTSFNYNKDFPHMNYKGIFYKYSDWEKYLDYYGIDKDFEKTGKKLIFTDFICTGKSSNIFKNILEKLDFDQNIEITNFSDLINNLDKKEKEKLNSYLFNVKFKYLSEKMSAKYTYRADIDPIKTPEYIENQGERFVSKLLKFAVFENLAEKKTPFFKRFFRKIFKK